MLTRDGPKVVEFNCRFGDPETQAMLPLIDIRPPLYEVVERVGRGERLTGSTGWSSPGACVATVVAAPGYPEKPETGQRLRVPRVEDVGVILFHAGTRRDESGQLVTAGGRVLTVVATARTLEEAQRLSTHYAGLVELPGKQYRSDIGWRELGRRARAS